MSSSSPEDLAIAFRSFDRRFREALGDNKAGAVSDLADTLREHVGAAAAALGTSADAASVAGELDRRPADQWDDATLDEVRRHALEAGGVLRKVDERFADSGDDDGGASSDTW